jgi:hypothetical protein
VMIASRIQAHPDYFGDRVGYLVSRAAAITLPTASGPIHVIGGCCILRSPGRGDRQSHLIRSPAPARRRQQGPVG